MAGNYGDGVWDSGTYGDPLAPSPGGSSSIWGEARWAEGYWSQRVWAPGAVWKDAWRWWYQYGRTADPDWDLTERVVEAQWSSDSFALGDGSWCGDLQPGRLNLKLYDPSQQLLGLSRLGTIWATFTPTGATWCWFVNTITVQLAPVGTPILNELVVTADAWPSRLTASSYQAARPAESVQARIQAIADRLNTDTGLVLPAVGASIEPDAHVVPAVVQMSGESSSVFPGYLQQLREAASNGRMWLEAYPGGGVGLPGVLEVRYVLWDTPEARYLTNDQVVASSIWSQGLDQLITEVAWAGTDAAGVPADYSQYSAGWGAYGLHKVGPMRIWGDLSQGGAQRAAVDTTGTETLNRRADPAVTYVDSIEMISGDRARVGWDPTRMVWPPHGVIQWFRVPDQPQESYRVTRSEHRLDARSWAVVHSLEPFIQPAHIP